MKKSTTLLCCSLRATIETLNLNNLIKKSIVFLFVFALSIQAKAQYFRTNGTQILNPNGTPAYFSGMNLGNWLLWEGYLMMGEHGFKTHSQFFNGVKAAFGNNHGQAMDFQHQWRMNYVTEQTIIDLKSRGFNSVRVPFHYNLFWNGSALTNDGFFYFDRLIGWCRTHGVSVLLDMHAAPGHQNPGDHSDNNASNENQPRTSVTFWDGNNVNIASQIWRHIAQRYANEPVIWGYDLINEPVPQDGREYELLPSLVTMRNAIRQVDNNHIIVAEGSWWGSDMQKIDWTDATVRSRTGITSKWDNNLVYQTHHYPAWDYTSNEIAVLNERRDRMNRLNVPLILGEYGENTDAKMLEMTNWCKSNNVGYFPWSFKKMYFGGSIWTVPGNTAYNRVRDFIKSGGTPPNNYNDVIAFCNNNIANGKPGITFNQGWFDAVKPSTAPGNIPFGQTIWLRGSNNLYVTGQNGTQPMRCDKGAVGSWEKFLVENVGGKVALKSMGKYVSSEDGAESGITCNRPSVGGAWETFTWEAVGTNQVALKGSNNMYISSENNERAMRCNRATRGAWEVFTYGITSAARLGETPKEELSVSYFPNPIADKLNYTINSGSSSHTISIKDFSGKLISQKSLTTDADFNAIDLSSLKAGIYIINVVDNSGTKTFKIQKL